MFKALAGCLTLLAIAVGGPANAQPSANGTHSTDQHDLTLSGSEEIASKLAGSSGQALLTAMETWVSSQFDLAAIHEHPRIEFAPPAKIASLRSTDLLSDPGAQVESNNRASSAQHDTIAVYDDAMLKALACCLTLLAIAIGGPAPNRRRTALARRISKRSP